jgi:hypothetical protein
MSSPWRPILQYMSLEERREHSNRNYSRANGTMAETNSKMLEVHSVATVLLRTPDPPFTFLFLPPEAPPFSSCFFSFGWSLGEWGAQVIVSLSH